MKVAWRRSHTLLALGIIIALISGLYVWTGGDAQAIAACKNGPENFAPLCYTNLIEKTLKDRGLSEALKVVADAGAADTNFSLYCHGNMHELGKAAYDIYHKTGRIDISPELSYCGYGFYHGFIEEMFAQTGTVHEARAFCDALSTKLTDQTVAVSNCYHGIGHGVTDGYDPRAWGNPAAIVAPGLRLCKEISPGDELHRSCAMGVFNSLELMYEDSKYKLDPSQGPFASCGKPYTKIEKDACYTEMSVLATTVFGADYAKAFNSANTVEPAYRARAVAYLGLFSMSQKVPSPKEVLAVCKSELPDYADSCVTGIVQGLVKYGEPGKEYDTAVSFCRSSQLDPAEEQLCTKTIVNSDVYTPAEREAVCKHFPQDYMPQSCINV